MRMSNHRTGGPMHESHRAPLTTGRLALWLGFCLILALLVMATVISLVQGGNA
jgi:hypothetical protein